MNAFKTFLKATPLYTPLKALYKRIRNAPRHPLQNIKTKKGLNLLHLGTDYGGWVFEDAPYLQGCTIISAGLGEDASFDVEFAQKYKARVIIVDPTPRAVAHYKSLSHRFGKAKEQNYSTSGAQPVDAYDLTGLTENDLVLVQKAVWNTETVLKFFAPKNPDHVSHSIVNYQNEYAEDTAFIEVDALPVSDLLAVQGINPKDVPLIKLDIEGAEVEVIIDFLAKGVRPKQILVEFDELNVPSDNAYKRIDKVHDHLVRYGYVCVRTDGQADFLYLLSPSYSPSAS